MTVRVGPLAEPHPEESVVERHAAAGLVAPAVVMEAHRDRRGLCVGRAHLRHWEAPGARVSTVAPPDVRVGCLDVGALRGRESQY